MLPLSQLILLVILIVVALLLLNWEATQTRTHWDEPPDDDSPVETGLANQDRN